MEGREKHQAGGQFLRFCTVGASNAVIDFGVLNVLLWLRPTALGVVLLAYNTLAVLLAATNSFVWNRRFTFRLRGPVTGAEIARFGVIALGTAALNTTVLAILTRAFPRLMTSGLAGANLLKVGAIVGAMVLSFFGMRLWVFLRRDGGNDAESPASRMEPTRPSLALLRPPVRPALARVRLMPF